MIHAYDPATGDLRGVCQGPSPEQAADWQAKGLTVLLGPAVSRERYNYLGGELTAKLLLTLTADRAVIAADGQDQAVVTVTAASTGWSDPEPPAEPEPLYPASVAVAVDGVGQEVALTQGQGTLAVAAAQPGRLSVRAADQVAAYDAGGLEIEAR